MLWGESGRSSRLYSSQVALYLTLFKLLSTEQSIAEKRRLDREYCLRSCMHKPTIRRESRILSK